MAIPPKPPPNAEPAPTISLSVKSPGVIEPAQKLRRTSGVRRAAVVPKSNLPLELTTPAGFKNSLTPLLPANLDTPRKTEPNMIMPPFAALELLVQRLLPQLY